MAGGKGTRLWPLTDDDVRPKPMAYLGSKRMLEFQFDIFERAGYVEPVIAVQYMAGNIVDAMGDGSAFVYERGDEAVPLKITYSYAPPGKPFKGTSDAIRKSRVYMADAVVVRDRHTQEERIVSAEDYLKNKARAGFQRFVEDFNAIVIGSGDVLTNFDIAQLVEFHYARGAMATIAGYQIGDPTKIVGKFGTMTMDEHGKIRSFAEKPKTLQEVDSNTINAGIYVFDRSILDWLDRNEDMIDFGHDVFPELLRRGEPIYAAAMKGYWDDVGTLDVYKATAQRLIDGIDGIDIRSHIKVSQKSNRINGTVKHSLVPQGCEIGHGSAVKDCVLGNNTIIGRNARLEGCVVMPEAVIGNNVKARDLIIDRDVRIDQGAQLGEGVVLGKSVHVTKNAVIHPGVKIRPNAVIRGEVKEDLLPES